MAEQREQQQQDGRRDREDGPSGAGPSGLQRERSFGAQVHSEHLDRLHFHVLGDEHRGSPHAARELAMALASMSANQYDIIRRRLLPQEQRAMDLSRQEGFDLAGK